MKKVRFLEDHDGARKGDIVSFDHDAEADGLVEAGKAEHVPFTAKNIPDPAEE